MVGQGLIGIIAILGLAWVAGERRKKVAWRIIGGGLGLQIALALILIWLPPTRGILSGANVVVDGLQAATRAGTSFVFGYLGGGEAPFAVTPSSTTFVLAFQALPLILLVSALSSTGASCNPSSKDSAGSSADRSASAAPLALRWRRTSSSA
jgi:concentrative nucleoside transporter, CNT family